MAILDPTVPRAGVSRLRTAGAATLLAVALMPLASMQPWAQAAAPDATDDIAAQGLTQSQPTPAQMQSGVASAIQDAVPATATSAARPIVQPRALRPQRSVQGGGSGGSGLDKSGSGLENEANSGEMRGAVRRGSTGGREAMPGSTRSGSADCGITRYNSKDCQRASISGSPGGEATWVGAACTRRGGRSGTADWLSPKSSNNRFFMDGTCLRTGRV